MKLTEREKNEDMMTTWGRIHQISKNLVMFDYDPERKQEHIDRLALLIRKFNEDLSSARVEYWRKNDNQNTI